MDLPAYPYVRFFGILNADAASPLVTQCLEFIQAVRDGITADDLAVVLDQAHAIYKLRCHALDMVVHQYGEKDESTREEIALKILDLLQFMFRFESDVPDLKRRYEDLTTSGLGRLMIARVEDPHELLPADRYGWWISLHKTERQVVMLNTKSLSLYPQKLVTAAEKAIKAAIETKAEPASWVELTTSQKSAMDDLLHHWQMMRQNPIVAGISTRPMPLIAAQSGVGKTFLVRHFAKWNQMPILELDSSSWIVHGATNRPYTLETAAKWVAENHEGLIMIDELDKCEGGADGGSSWNRHVRGEIFSLLDRRLGASLGWDKETIRKLDDFFIVGLGTWQHLHRAKPSVGFREQAAEKVDIFKNNDSIPEELLFRFNSEVVYLTSPSAEEFAKRIATIHTNVGMPMPNNIAQLAREAVASGLATRWLESYLSRLLRLRQKSLAERIAARLRSVERAKVITGAPEQESRYDALFGLVEDNEEESP